jgi:hypothetical protein
MKHYRFKAKCAFYSYVGIAIIIILLAIMNSCCIAQIPTQYYLATDSCEFYLPDYTKVIEVRDNCCVDTASFYQVPNSGVLLTPGDEVQVTIYAKDCYGNKASMSFDVVIVDKIPPTFHYDSTLFTPLGHYQNENRTWHFWTDADPNIEKTDPPLYYSHGKTARDRTTGIGEIHDAYYRNDQYYKMSLFMAKSTYRIMDMYMALAKVGNPQGKLHVEIWQLNMVDTSLLHPICGTRVDLNDIHSRNSSDPQDLPAEELIWHTVDVSDGVLIRGGWYAIRTYCEGLVQGDDRVIWNTNDYEDNDPYKFLKYSYDNEESYGTNQEASYMYQIWGIDIV